jgi:hypothetical protein
MKSVRFYIGIVFVIAVLLTAVSAEDTQQPFIDNGVVTIEDPAFVDGVIHDAIVDDQDKEDPVPPPIWSLCGNPSKHLLIPYPCS